MFHHVLNTPVGFPQNSYSDKSDKIEDEIMEKKFFSEFQVAICSPFHEESIATIFQYFKTFSKVPFPIPLWTIIVKHVTFHKKKQMRLLILYYLSEQYIQKCKTWLYFILIHFFTFNDNDKRKHSLPYNCKTFPYQKIKYTFQGSLGITPPSLR